MTKQKLVLYASFLMLGYVFLPIIFMNVPIVGKWFIAVPAFLVSAIVSYPNILIRKEVLVLFFFGVVYFFIAPITGNTQEQMWFTHRFLPLLVAVFLYIYYVRTPYDSKNLRIIFWFTIIAIIISSISTIIGLIKFPNASRELASDVYGNIDMTKFYRRIGIMGYGFMSALAYVIPLLVLFYKKPRSSIWKWVFLFAIIITFYVELKAQYTTQFLLFSMALLLSMYGTTIFLKYKGLIMFFLLVLVVIPSTFYADFVYSISDIIPGETLKVRIMDISETIREGDISTSDTHVAERFSRIPFLIEEFLKNPIYGGGKSTSHVFWLDHLSLYGIIGTTPWVLLLIMHYKDVKKRLGETFVYYQIAFLMFIVLGFMKNSGNREQYFIIFVILPIGLILYEKGELFKRKKHEISR